MKSKDIMSLLKRREKELQSHAEYSDHDAIRAMEVRWLIDLIESIDRGRKGRKG